MRRTPPGDEATPVSPGDGASLRVGSSLVHSRATAVSPTRAGG
jgi:hypothetical protein